MLGVFRTDVLKDYLIGWPRCAGVGAQLYAKLRWENQKFKQLNETIFQNKNIKMELNVYHGGRAFA